MNFQLSRRSFLKGAPAPARKGRIRAKWETFDQVRLARAAHLKHTVEEPPPLMN